MGSLAILLTCSSGGYNALDFNARAEPIPEDLEESIDANHFLEMCGIFSQYRSPQDIYCMTNRDNNLAGPVSNIVVTISHLDTKTWENRVEIEKYQG